MNQSWHRVVAHRYGPPSSLRIEPFTPPSPQRGEVRVRVEAAGVNAGDWHLLRASPAIVRLFFGLRCPKHPVLGSDVAGIVEEVGDGVTDLQVGDAVMGSLSTFGFGAFSQVVVKPSEAFVKMPAGISFEMAAAVPEAGMTALQAVEQACSNTDVRRLLNYGASGGVGSAATQIAVARGLDVTAVCSAGKVEHVASYGAARTTHYEDDLPKDFDAVVIANSRRSLTYYLDRVRRGGRCVLVGSPGYQFLRAGLFGLIARPLWNKSLASFLVKPDRGSLAGVVRLLETGALRPHVDRTFTLSEIGEALAFLEAGQARGKVVIRPQNEPS